MVAEDAVLVRPLMVVAEAEAGLERGYLCLFLFCRRRYMSLWVMGELVVLALL